MSRLRRGVLRLLAAFLAAGVAGLAALGLALASLPPLDWERLAARSPVVLDREGRLLRAFVMPDGRWRMPIRPEDVDPRFLQMLLAYEDRRFYSHFGVDPLALLRAGLQAATTGRVVSGASTLTMQVARLAEPRRRSLSAKLRQMVRAIDLERRLSKQEILALYLSLAPYGGNVEGLRAASLAYFAKEPRRLSTAEAALLVGLPQAPEARRPDRFPAAAAAARERVLARLGEAGLVQAGERRAAASEPVPGARYAFPMLAPHLAETALAERKSQPIQQLTLDARWQAGLQALARERAEALGPRLAVAIVVVDHATGEIRASVGGGDYFSAERAGGIDLTRAVRSPGSALKPLIYAIAFDEGIAHPETMLEDRPARFGFYAPENFDDSFHGMVTARKALQLSLNLPAVDLLSAVGPQRFLNRLRQSGAEVFLPRDSAPGLAVGLGGIGISLRDLTQLYAGLAQGGAMHPLHHREEAASGEPVRILEPVSAWYVLDILMGAPPPPNAPAGRILFKTGTSYGYRDAWAVGSDRRHTIGVWVGRPDNGAVPGLVGRTVAAPVLFEAFARIGTEPGNPMPRPAAALLASTARLPPPLRHLRQDVAKTVDALAVPALRVAFPPEGAVIEAAAGSDGRPLLALKITGGVPPFTTLINGIPVQAGQSRRAASLTPETLGFLRISVIDAAGSTDSVQIRLR